MAKRAAKTRNDAVKAGPEQSYHHGDLRAALLAAARRTLETEGLAALSLRGVARDAGVSQAAPYHHFASKDAILAAVAAQGFAELADAMEARMAAAADPLDRLNAAGIAYVVFAVDNPELFRLMFGGAGYPKGADPTLAESGKRAYAVLERALAAVPAAEGGAARQGPIASLYSWSLVHGLAKLLIEAGLRPADYGAEDIETLAARVLGRAGG